MLIADETQIENGQILKPIKGRPSWKNRRIIIIGSLLFCAFCVAYIMFQGNDTRVNETIALGCFYLAGAIIGSYVFGAAWQDVAIEKIKSNSPTLSQVRNTNPIDLTIGPVTLDGKDQDD